jgi:hypothetical protein
LKITENLDLHQEARGDAILFLKNAFPRKLPDFKIIPTTETEIKSIIQSLKAKNSTGYDGIISKILEACASLISHPLTQIYNLSPSSCKCLSCATFIMQTTGVALDWAMIFDWILYYTIPYLIWCL